MSLFNNTSASVTSTASSIWDSNDDAGWLELRNLGPVAVYLGGASTVDVTTGYPLYPGERLTIATAGSANSAYMYAVTESGSADVRIMQAGT